jgi:ribosomal protein S20
MVQPHDAIEPIAQHPREMTMSIFRLAGFAALLVAAALAGGTIIGSVAAANVPRSADMATGAAAPSAGAPGASTKGAAYCADFRRAFAANLGVDESALAPAAKAAAMSTIEAALAAGDITKAAADRMKARIEKAAADGCALLAGRIGALRGAVGGQALTVARDGLGAAAAVLGIAPAQLGADLRAGRTLKEVAVARGVPYDAVSAAVVKAVKADLDAAVAAGTIKQARADRILARLHRNLADGRLGNPRSAAPAGPSGSAAPATGS